MCPENVGQERRNMFLEDKSGYHRLDAVVSITPHEVRNHGKDYQAPVQRVVAKLHFAGGHSVITDTDYKDVVSNVTPEPRSNQEGA
jgi:hypothetical protein